jgi:hypothetical protein
MLKKFGARTWIPGIMFCWGLIMMYILLFGNLASEPNNRRLGALASSKTSKDYSLAVSSSVHLKRTWHY